MCVNVGVRSSRKVELYSLKDFVITVHLIFFFLRECTVSPVLSISTTSH